MKILRGHLCPPPIFFFLSFLALNAVFSMMDLSIFFPALESLKTLHVLRCLASYRIRLNVQACFISAYMAQEHTTAQTPDVGFFV